MLVSAIQGLTLPSSKANAEADPWQQIPSTMVFVNTAQTAKDLTFLLQRKQVPCVDFHKLVPEPEKSSNLERFRQGEMKIIVCTDSAARGLDLPAVKHVVQAEFAQNVVQHLHRIGRASRAGAIGYATNFYDDSVLQLVKTILPTKADASIMTPEPVTQDQMKKDRSVQQAFSRRRGLRRKQKRYEQKLSAESEGADAVRAPLPSINDSTILDDIAN
jgi:superfamily II DNA/RNA helicase